MDKSRWTWVWSIITVGIIFIVLWLRGSNLLGILISQWKPKSQISTSILILLFITVFPALIAVLFSQSNKKRQEGLFLDGKPLYIGLDLSLSHENYEKNPPPTSSEKGWRFLVEVDTNNIKFYPVVEFLGYSTSKYDSRYWNPPPESYIETSKSKEPETSIALSKISLIEIAQFRNNLTEGLMEAFVTIKTNEETKKFYTYEGNKLLDVLEKLNLPLKYDKEAIAKARRTLNFISNPMVLVTTGIFGVLFLIYFINFLLKIFGFYAAFS